MTMRLRTLWILCPLVVVPVALTFGVIGYAVEGGAGVVVRVCWIVVEFCRRMTDLMADEAHAAELANSPRAVPASGTDGGTTP